MITQNVNLERVNCKVFHLTKVNLEVIDENQTFK